MNIFLIFFFYSKRGKFTKLKAISVTKKSAKSKNNSLLQQNSVEFVTDFTQTVKNLHKHFLHAFTFFHLYLPYQISWSNCAPYEGFWWPIKNKEWDRKIQSGLFWYLRGYSRTHCKHWAISFVVGSSAPRGWIQQISLISFAAFRSVQRVLVATDLFGLEYIANFQWLIKGLWVPYLLWVNKD